MPNNVKLCLTHFSKGAKNCAGGRYAHAKPPCVPLVTGPAIRNLKASVFWPRNDKAHAELRLFYQSVYQPPAFRHSWALSQGTWSSRPTAVYCHLLVAYTYLNNFQRKVYQTSWQIQIRPRQSNCHLFINFLSCLFVAWNCYCLRSKPLQPLRW